MTNLHLNFSQELKNANTQNPSSLAFIKHTISTNPIVQPHEVFQVIVIGGSIYQKALLEKKGKKLHLIHQDQGEQPSFKTKESLMTFLEDHVDPTIQSLAINFAYPMEPISRNDLLDGKLKSGSKENTFKGLVGQNVGEEIEKHFAKKGQKIRVSIANDTICLLLSGLTQYSWNQLAAGIVGTGLNFAIFNDEITPINLESANFDKFEQTEEGRVIDQKSSSPGTALCEKEVSGAYLYQHFNLIAEKKGWPTRLNSTQELDILAQHGHNEECSVAKELLNRSARLTAIQVAGILEYCKRDLFFIMQGSLFWRGFQYKETVEKLVEKLCPEYKATYINIFHSDLYGAAKLIS